MPDPTYTLSELAGLVDIHPRTIRSYIQQDLLRGPDTMGRNARYSDYHRKRLEAIKTLRSDYALPLDEIRRLVSLADIDEDIKIASLPTPRGTCSERQFVTRWAFPQAPFSAPCSSASSLPGCSRVR